MSCVIRKPVLPAWVGINTFVIAFICSLTLLPLAIMRPTSLSLEVYLCRHTERKQRSSLAEYCRLVCRLAVALVWVYLTMLLIISCHYLHGLFASAASANTCNRRRQWSNSQSVTEYWWSKLKRIIFYFGSCLVSKKTIHSVLMTLHVHMQAVIMCIVRISWWIDKIFLKTVQWCWSSTLLPTGGNKGLSLLG